MYRNYGSSARGDRTFDSRRIKAKRLWLDVDHNRLSTGIGDRIGGRDKGEIGYDHFVARSDADSKQGQVEASRAVANGKRVFRPAILGKAALEILNVWP